MSKAVAAAASALQDTFAAIDRIRTANPVLTQRPKGGITATEYADKYGYSWQKSVYDLTGLVRQGKLSRCKVLLPAQDGRLCAQWVYSVK